MNDTDPAGTSAAHLTLTSTATLTGSGVVSLSGPNNYIDGTGKLTNEQTIQGTGNIDLASMTNKGTINAIGSGSDTLNNNGNTIEGSGNIGNGQMNLTNGPKGTIYANQGYPLIIQAGAGNTFNNAGTLSTAPPNSILDITGGTFSNFNANTGTLTGGKYNVSGTLQFDNANIVNNAANITLGVPTAQILNQNNVNALLNFSNNLSGGSFTLAGGENFATQGVFTNAGSMTVEKSSAFTVGGTSTNYNQTGGTTTVDGTLTAPAGGLVDATGGTLQGAGTFSGSVSLGNASGTAATFIVGDSIKKAALVSISDNYTQLATGVLDA